MFVGVLRAPRIQPHLRASRSGGRCGCSARLQVRKPFPHLTYESMPRQGWFSMTVIRGRKVGCLICADEEELG